jgi:hypothetical protein
MVDDWVSLIWPSAGESNRVHNLQHASWIRHPCMSIETFRLISQGAFKQSSGSTQKLPASTSQWFGISMLSITVVCGLALLPLVDTPSAIRVSECIFSTQVMIVSYITVDKTLIRGHTVVTTLRTRKRGGELHRLPRNMLK